MKTCRHHGVLVAARHPSGAAQPRLFSAKTFSFLHALVLVVLLLGTVITEHGISATITVTNSIQAAVDSAAPGDTVLIPAGTYSVMNEIILAKNLTLQGMGADRTVVEAYSFFSRVFAISSNTTVNLIGVTITNGFFQPSVYNLDERGGAGIRNLGNLTIRNCAVVNNITWNAFGGGIYSSGNLTLISSTIYGNLVRGGDGARMLDWGGGGGGAGLGGGLYVAAGEVTITNCTFSGNNAVGGNGGSGSIQAGTGTGGGPYGGARGFGVVDGTNGAPGQPGGHGSGGGSGGAAPKDVFTHDYIGIGGTGGSGGFGGGGGGGGPGRPFTSSQGGPGGQHGYPGVSGTGGRGAGIGGGIFVEGSSVTVVNSTFAQNQADVGTGIYNRVGNLRLLNTIVAQELWGSFENLGSNLVGTVPGLGPLQNNGGATCTCALLANSPAINAGTPSGAPAFDQRGVSRPQGSAVDIGAFELECPVANQVLPMNQIIPPGSNVTFCLTASGLPPLSYQWRLNGNNVSGATSNCYTVSGAQAGNAGSYDVVVSNSCGTVTSSAATLTVRSMIHFELPTYYFSEDQTNAIVRVVKEGNRAASVSYYTQDGTGPNAARYIAGGLSDYSARNGFLSFGAGEFIKEIIIPIADDFFAEPAEWFSVYLDFPDSGSELIAPFATIVGINPSDIGADTNSLLQPKLPSFIDTETLGSLQLFLNGANGLGRWHLPADTAWRERGSTAFNLEPGNDWEATFAPVANAVAPPTERLPVQAGALTSYVRNYADVPAPVGTLRVRLEPTNALAAFGWRLAGETNAWRREDALVSVPEGDYLIEFHSTSFAWSAPTPHGVRVFPSAESEIRAAFQVVQPRQGVRLPQEVLSLEEINTGFQNGVPRRPYPFSGQLRSSSGFASGFVVRERVVLTAAHVVFDDTTLQMASEVLWFPRRLEGDFEPRPKRAQGWIVMPGYIEQRISERANGANPGEPRSGSQALDAAAVWFDEPALRFAGNGEGEGGCLVSDPNGTNYLASASYALLLGYPIEGPADQIFPGRMHWLEENPLSSQNRFLPVVAGDQRVYSSRAFLSFPGNSGGPICVIGGGTATPTYFPAGIYLGSDDVRSYVRTIDTNVLALINYAATAAKLGANFTGGGVIYVGVTSGTNTVQRVNVTVELSPASVVAAGAGWRFQAESTFRTNVTTNLTLSANNYTLVFQPVPGAFTPTNYPLNLAGVTGLQSVRVTATYGLPALMYSLARGLVLDAPTGLTYRVQFRDSLSPTDSWSTLNTVTPASNPWPAGNPARTNRARFFRTVFPP